MTDQVFINLVAGALCLWAYVTGRLVWEVFNLRKDAEENQDDISVLVATAEYDNKVSSARFYALRDITTMTDVLQMRDRASEALHYD
jgi:hypothetical protein